MTAKQNIQNAKGAHIFKKMLDDKRALQKIADESTSTEDYVKKVKAFNKKRKHIAPAI